jgi:fatty-acid peroxygenase
MSPIPRDKHLDSMLALLLDGYTFISKRCHRYQSDIFETRLMLQKVTCMMGEEAASVFYHPNRFTRRGAMPKMALWLLQDTGSVALLDKEAHHW